MSATARRRQPPITIRSARAVARLALLTRDGRSQAQAIEEALERMPLPRHMVDKAAVRAERSDRGPWTPLGRQIDGGDRR